MKFIANTSGGVPQGWAEGTYKLRSMEVQNNCLAVPPQRNMQFQVWGSGDLAAMDARDVMQKRLCNIAASEAKIDTAALFGYGSDGKQVCFVPRAFFEANKNYCE